MKFVLDEIDKSNYSKFYNMMFNLIYSEQFYETTMVISYKDYQC